MSRFSQVVDSHIHLISVNFVVLYLQTIRNNWDTVIQEKVEEYKDKMQAYRSINRNGWVHFHTSGIRVVLLCERSSKK